MNFAVLRETIDGTLSKLDRAKDRRTQEKKAFREMTSLVDDTVEATNIAKSVARDIQAKVCGCVAGVVSRCLEAVFDEPYIFKMSFVEKRGRTEVELSFEKEGQEIDPLTASGGGVVDVAAFALRLAAILLSGPSSRLLLVLDEPFKFVSQQYRGRIRQLLNDLASEMGVQIIMVTHIEELQTGTIVEIR